MRGTDQALMTWSFEHEKSRSPSALYTTCVRDRSCPGGEADEMISIYALYTRETRGPAYLGGGWVAGEVKNKAT